MLQYVLDNEELEEKITSFCKNPIKPHTRIINDADEINIALSWWEMEKIWLLGQVRQLKLTEVNTFHLAPDASYMDRVIRVVNDVNRACKWGYMVYKNVTDCYDRDILFAKLTSAAEGDPKFMVPKSAIINQVDGSTTHSTANIRGWKNLCDVKFGKSKVHVVTTSHDNFVPAVIFACSSMAVGGILLANVVLNDNVKRYIKLLQSCFESVQIRTSSWSNEIFICATGFTKCPKKVSDYMICHVEELVSFALVPMMKHELYAIDYVTVVNEKISLSDWIAETAF